MKAPTVRLADVTLRDGELTPNVHFDTAQKREITLALLDAGIARVEVGFPARYERDRESLHEIIAAEPSASICVLSGVGLEDIDCSLRYLRGAHAPRVHLYAGGHTRQDQRMIDEAVAGIRHACEHLDDVAFSPLDATRLEHDFLSRFVREAIDAGAGTINVSDTLGIATPNDIETLFSDLTSTGGSEVVWSFHGHDDLGLATANSWAAVLGGARQIEACVQGLGPRAGNTSIEEVVRLLAQHGPRHGLTSDIDLDKLRAVSELVGGVIGATPSTTT